MFRHKRTNQDKLLQKLLSNQGSIAEKTSIAQSLDDAHLQKAVSHSDYAKIEWESRQNKKRWFEKPLGIIALAALGAVLAALVLYLLWGQML